LVSPKQSCENERVWTMQKEIRFYRLMLVLFLVVTSSGCNSNGSNSVSSSSLSVSSSKKSLGTLRPGVEPDIVRFEIKNNGEDNIKLSQVQLSCACADANLDRVSLKPGETAQLGIRVFTNKPGDHTAVAIVQTNSRDNPTLAFELSWTVYLGVSADRNLITAKDIRLNQPYQQIINVELDVALRGKVRLRTIPDDVVGAVLQGNDSELVVSVTASESTNNELKTGYVVVERTSGETLLTIPVRWITLDEFSLQPSRLVVSGKAGDVVRKQILFRQVGNDFDQFSLTSTSDNVQFVKQQQGSNFVIFDIEWSLTEGDISDANFITVQSSRFGEQKIPLLVLR